MLEIKDHLIVALFLVPIFKFLTGFGGHGFGHVVVDRRDGSHVLLVFGDVELVGEITLFEFGEPEGFGKRRKRHLEETERMNEAETVVFDFQEFTPIA